MIRLQTFLWIAVLALLTCTASAQRASGLSADFPDRRTLSVQRKVDDLFDEAKFERAFFIYRNELVPLGDKYAQYMVGYMFLTGLGVEEDVAAAYAWYRLAAERDTPEFVAVRNRLKANLLDDQIQRSMSVYVELRREYCDLAVLLLSIKRTQRDLQSRTGSRLQNSSPMIVLETSGNGMTVSGSEAAFRKALSIVPQHTPSATRLGDVLLEQGRPAEAAEAFRHALRYAPGDLKAQEGLRRATKSGG